MKIFDFDNQNSDVLEKERVKEGIFWLRGGDEWGGGRKYKILDPSENPPSEYSSCKWYKALKTPVFLLCYYLVLLRRRLKFRYFSKMGEGRKVLILEVNILLGGGGLLGILVEKHKHAYKNRFYVQG